MLGKSKLNNKIKLYVCIVHCTMQILLWWKGSVLCCTVVYTFWVHHWNGVLTRRERKASKHTVMRDFWWIFCWWVITAKSPTHISFVNISLILRLHKKVWMNKSLSLKLIFDSFYCKDYNNNLKWFLRERK